jgi:hypothetical protein
MNKTEFQKTGAVRKSFQATEDVISGTLDAAAHH